MNEFTLQRRIANILCRGFLRIAQGLKLSLFIIACLLLCENGKIIQDEAHKRIKYFVARQETVWSSTQDVSSDFKSFSSERPCVAVHGACIDNGKLESVNKNGDFLRQSLI